MASFKVTTRRFARISIFVGRRPAAISCPSAAPHDLPDSGQACDAFRMTNAGRVRPPIAMPTFAEVRLDTKRLRLRPLVRSDADALLAIHADPQVMRYTTIRPWTSLEQAHALIERDVQDMPAGKHLCLGIVPAGEDQVAGTCTLFGIYRASQRAEIGFVLGRSAWGNGYMKEALSALRGLRFRQHESQSGRG